MAPRRPDLTRGTRHTDPPDPSTEGSGFGVPGKGYNTMNLDPEDREQIIADYAESCRLRSIQIGIRGLNLTDPAAHNRNCREDVILSIRQGKDTWERIAEVAAEHRKTR